MPTRSFARAALDALGVPPTEPDDVEYSDTLLADERVTTLKYTELRRCVFAAPDDGRTYAVEYEAALDVGDFEVGGGEPDDHGWYGDTVEVVEVAERHALVTRWTPATDEAGPGGVLAEIAAERAAQDARWGEQGHPDGTGGPVMRARAAEARAACQYLADNGGPDWRSILLEEVYEALAEEDPARLRAELVQVAAVATAWIESIDRRAGQ